MFSDALTARLHLATVLASCAVCISAGELIAAPGKSNQSPAAAKESTPNSNAKGVTEFTITDGTECDTVREGKHNLAGTLKINFAGRIVPHENTEVVLFGDGVTSVSGKFERIEVPAGWQYEIEYDYQKPAVVMKNFRPDRPIAFPGAEGFGKYSVGGRGGKVIAVTNLNDSGPGSFRAACTAKGPRIVVFRVSGTIPLQSQIKIENPYLTIAGQTAPGDGICVRNHEVKFDTHDVIIRYIRFRPGDESGIIYDGFGGEGDQIVIDHCSVSWGIDETFSINKASNLTVQWCMVTESLYESIHKKGHHGYGGLWGGPGGSWHHNILAHHTSRNPRASGNVDSGLMDFRNNVIYNWGFNSAYGGELWPRNWVNNYYKYGPATEEKVKRRIFLQGNAKGKMFADGNYIWGFPKITKDNWAGGIDFTDDGDASEATLRAKKPFVVAPVTTQPAEQAFELVVKNAGASLSRDSVDSRIAEEIKSGTAKFGKSYRGGGNGIIDSQSDVGGWPELKSSPAPADTDGDGMPDSWEVEHNLDPKNAADGSAVAMGASYTNVEVYLNSLTPLM